MMMKKKEEREEEEMMTGRFCLIKQPKLMGEKRMERMKMVERMKKMVMGSIWANAPCQTLTIRTMPQ
jgi:hypothetical protein